MVPVATLTFPRAVPDTAPIALHFPATFSYSGKFNLEDLGSFTEL